MMSDDPDQGITLRPWSPEDLPLLQQLLGDPQMMVHLGGPESSEQIQQRHMHYCESVDSDTTYVLVILVGDREERAGSLVFWERTWQSELVWESGWSVLPAFQGRGIATRALTQMLEAARATGKHRYVHAYPSVDNGPSNAICSKAGFTLCGDFDSEYPPGHYLHINDWRYDLLASGPSSQSQ